MSDLIDRRLVIEIIQSMYPGMPRITWMRKDWQERYEPYIRTENAIRNLPSAQLSPCEFCKHNDTSDEVACLMCSAERSKDE